MEIDRDTQQLSSGSRDKTATISQSQEKRSITPRFLVVKRTDGENFDKVSPFVLIKILNGVVGNLRNIRKTKDGLLLETISEQQAKRLLQIQKLDNFDVSIEPHRSLNYAKGVITCRDLLNCSLEEIKEGLASEGVIDIKRIKTKRDGELVDTANLILTFDKPKLPLKVRAAFYSLDVRPYIPDPVRCFNCQRFGHVSLACTKPKICVCGKPPHIGHICENPVCVNCEGEHSARSKKCPRMIEEINIQTIKTNEKITYGEAKRKITISMPNSGTYSSKVKTTNNIDVIVDTLIPKMTKIIESQIQELYKALTVTQPATHTFSQPMVPDNELTTFDSNKRKIVDDSLESDESNFSSQVSDTSRTGRKKKKGWQKGKPRKLSLDKLTNLPLPNPSPVDQQPVDQSPFLPLSLSPKEKEKTKDKKKT